MAPRARFLARFFFFASLVLAFVGGYFDWGWLRWMVTW